jgi:hypothetical protein
MPVAKKAKSGAEMSAERRRVCQYEDDHGVRVCRRVSVVTHRGRLYCVDHAEAQAQREADAISKRLPPVLSFPHMTTEKRERLAELHEDPMLLDPRPAIATERALLDDYIGAPPAYVQSMAYQIACIRWGDEAPASARVGGEPDGELLRLRPDPATDVREHHLVEARRRLAKQNADMINRYGESVLKASKIAKMNEVYLTIIEPFFQEFGIGIRRMYEDLVDDDALRDRLIAGTVSQVSALMARLRATAEEAKS